MTTVDRLMALADAYAQVDGKACTEEQLQKRYSELRAALQEQHTALTDAHTEIGGQARKNAELTASRDAYQVAADKLAGELKDMQRQEPIGYVYTIQGVAQGAMCDKTLKAGTPLYAAPTKDTP